MVTIALSNQHKNEKVLSLVVTENMTLFGTEFKSTGAVQMRPGHFYSMVQSGKDFVVLDSLRDRAPIYPTFGSAVKYTYDPQQMIGEGGRLYFR